MKAGSTDQIGRLACVVNAVQKITKLREQRATSDPTHGYALGTTAAIAASWAGYPAANRLPLDQRYAYDPAGNRDDANTSFFALGTHASSGPILVALRECGQTPSRAGIMF